MEEVALAGINNFVFAPYPTITADIFNQILQRQEDLERRVSELEAESRSKDATIEQLKADNRSLQEDLNELAETSALEHAFDRRRITSLEEAKASPQQPAQPIPSQGKKTKGRIEELKGLLKNNRGRAPFKDLRKAMGLTRSQFSQLISKLDKRLFLVEPRARNGREKVLVLRQRVG